MTNQDVSKILQHVAAAYTIKDERKYLFQKLAYQKASDIITHLPTQLKNLLKEKGKIPGVGPSIHTHLEELYSTGKVKHFDEILGSVPAAVFPLLDVTTLGPKKAYKLVSALKLSNPDTVVEDLIKAAKADKISGLETFGEKSQADIIQALEEYKLGKTKSNRMALPYAFELAKKVEAYLKEDKNAIKISPLGSLRRMRDTIGDIDFAVATKNPKESIEHFTKYPNVERIIEQGTASSSRY